MADLSPINLPLLRLNSTPNIKVLDHGYVRWVETWGSDEAIIEAARMSTDKGFLGWEPGVCPVCCGVGDGVQNSPCNACKGTGEHKGDAKLLAYLWKNKHSTPFEFAGMTFEVQAPLMVFREWHRHRTQSYAERSARYTPLPDYNYIPTIDRLMERGGHLTKQAASIDGVELTLESGIEWLAELADVYEDCERVYQSGLRRGVPKELSRLCVPVGRYSTMRASTDLRNWLGFAALRLPSTAQKEIRLYAQAVHSVLKSAFPRTVALFDEGMQA